jgi:hypothetical protein
MNRIKNASAVMALAAASIWGQESHLSVGNASWKGFEIWFVTKIEPPGTELFGGIVTDAGRVHHVINDDAHKRYFGYDLQLDPSNDGNSAQLRIEPLQTTRIGQISIGVGSTLLELPKYPVIPNVKVGDTIALDLLVNPATGQKIVDYLTVRRHGAPGYQRKAVDFTVADVEMTLNQPQVSLRGKPQASTSVGTSGAVVWFYLTGRGRYVLSLLPIEALGFKQRGAVSADGLILYDNDGAAIEVECSSRIAPGSGNYHLYVAYEPDWRPSGTDSFRIGSADRADWVIRKK